MFEISKYKIITHSVDISGAVGVDDDRFNQEIKDYIETGWKVKHFSVEDGDMYAEFYKTDSLPE